MNYSVLHIGKTGGTAIREALKNVSTEIGGVRVFRHGQTFKKNIKEYPESKVMFGIREPLSWFVSAFNSRAREGRPAYINPHNPLEKIAFDIFSTPNDGGLNDQVQHVTPQVRCCYDSMLSPSLC